MPLDRERCLQLLTTTTVGRIAFVDDQGVQLVPVNFALLDDAIYLRTLADGFIAGSIGHPVAFGVDYHGASFRLGWNVTVKGIVEEVTDEATRERVMTYERLDPWAGGDRTLVLRIGIDSIDGRRARAD